MIDSSIRQLERAVAAGDRAAIIRLERALTRAARPAWLRRLDQLRADLDQVEKKHKARAGVLLEAVGHLQSMFEAALEGPGAWERALYEAQTAHHLSSNRPIKDIEFPIDELFTWAWKICGEPGRSPRVMPARGDVVGSRTVLSVDRRFNYRSRIVHFRCGARGITGGLSLSKWRNWARNKNVTNLALYD